MRIGDLVRNRLALPLMGAVCGAAYGLTARSLSSPAVNGNVFGVVTLGFIFLMPLGIGYLTAYSARAPGVLYRIFMPWVSCLLFAGACFATGYEGAICIIMALPVMLVLSSIGAGIEALVRWLVRARGRQRGALAGILVLPFFTSGIESRLPLPSSIRIIEREIAIAAPPEKVWRHIERVDRIRPEEQAPSLFHRIGFPLPVEATLHGTGVGAFRRARFEGNVLFLETITEWNPPLSLTFTIEPNTAEIPPTTLDEHVIVGGEYFDVLEGAYRVEPLRTGGVILHLRSRYRLSTRFNFYSSVWGDAVMGSIQSNILGIVKKRCEEGA